MEMLTVTCKTLSTCVVEYLVKDITDRINKAQIALLKLNQTWCAKNLSWITKIRIFNCIIIWLHDLKPKRILKKFRALKSTHLIGAHKVTEAQVEHVNMYPLL